MHKQFVGGTDGALLLPASDNVIDYRVSGRASASQQDHAFDVSYPRDKHCRLLSLQVGPHMHTHFVIDGTCELA